MKPSRDRSTPQGEHRAVLLAEVLEVLDPKPGEIAVDCTLGFAGHAAELLRRVGPAGYLVGIDFDATNLPNARERLTAIGDNFHIHQGNFAGLATHLAEDQLDGADVVVADLGMSSMQVDDPERGFSYRRDGPLDMRMDPSRGRSAARILATISQSELENALRELGDEPEAGKIAAAIVLVRASAPFERTTQLATFLQGLLGEEEWRLHPQAGKWKLHPAARTFQALRLLVNRELANLEQLLRVLPTVLKPGGRAAIISFHSGEDRLVKHAFRAGLAGGLFQEASDEPIRPTFQERSTNPRSRSAKMRWALRMTR